MRHFAKRFSSLDDFEEQHPGVTTWSAVKKLLVTKARPSAKSAEAPAQGSEASSKQTDPADASNSDNTTAGDSSHKSDDSGQDEEDVPTVLAHLASVTEQLFRLASVHNAADREWILQAAQQLLDAAKKLREEAGEAN
jgi:hypothetical protein